VLVATHGGPVRRPYSIAVSPEDARREGCLELLVGVDANGSPGPHLTAAAGALVDVEGPLGSFTFPGAPEERRFVFIAGGTGIAPLRAMLHQALGIPGSRIGVFYSARTPDEFAYQDELRALAGAGRIELRQTVTRNADEGWHGTRGRINRVELQQLIHDPETLCFVCGPPSLVDEMPGLLGEVGVERRRIRLEEW
jgi:ferredoxin-NADP reductase